MSQLIASTYIRKLWITFSSEDSGEPSMAENKTVEINPKAFRIENNKLYLFYKTRWVDTHNKWGENTEELRVKADINWQNRRSKE